MSSTRLAILQGTLAAYNSEFKLVLDMKGIETGLHIDLANISELEKHYREIERNIKRAISKKD